MQQVQFVGFKQQHVVLMLSRCCPKNYLVFAPMEVQSLADMCLAHIQLLLNIIIIISVGRGRFHLGKRPQNKDTLFKKGPRDRTLILKFEEDDKMF